MGLFSDHLDRLFIDMERRRAVVWAWMGAGGGKGGWREEGWGVREGGLEMDGGEGRVVGIPEGFSMIRRESGFGHICHCRGILRSTCQESSS